MDSEDLKTQAKEGYKFDAILFFRTNNPFYEGRMSTFDWLLGKLGLSEEEICELYREAKDEFHEGPLND